MRAPIAHFPLPAAPMNDLQARAVDENWPAYFAATLHDRYEGSLAAIVLYGSWLRGKRDTVLDFYVLLDNYDGLASVFERLGNRVLAPNVYNLMLAKDGVTCTAKFATVTLDHFERAMGDDFHSYFWARFAQPIELVHVRDAATTTRIEHACTRAAKRMIVETTPLLAAEFTTADLWQRAFSSTYACELRSEDAFKPAELVAHYHDHLERLTQALAAECALQPVSPQSWRRSCIPGDGVQPAGRWRARRAVGKILSVARLFKAAFTFNQPLEYILWKVERHSGVLEQPTALQCRYPLLFAWPVLWRVYRRGGFR